MADEEKTEEEVKDETTEETTEEATEEKTEEEKEKAGEEETRAASKALDDELNREDDEEVVDEELSDDEKKAEEEAADKAEAEKKAEEEKAEEENTGTEKPEEISDELLEKAVKAGYTIAEAKTFTPASLEIAVSKTKTEEKADEEEEKPEVYDCKLDPEKYDEEVIRIQNEQGQRSNDLEFAMKKQAKDHAKELAVAKADSEKESLSAAAKVQDEALDKLFAEKKGFEGEFGKIGVGEKEDDGSYKLKEGSAEIKARAKVFKKIQVLQAGYEGTKSTMPSLEKLFNEAVSSVYSKKEKQLAVKGKTDKLGKQAKQTIGSGSSKSAVQTAEQKIRTASKALDAELDKQDD